MENNHFISKEEHNNRLQIAGKLVKLTKELYDTQLDLDLIKEDKKIAEIKEELNRLQNIGNTNKEVDYNNIEKLKAELERVKSTKYLENLLNVENFTVEIATKQQLNKIAELEEKINTLEEYEDKA